MDTLLGLINDCEKANDGVYEKEDENIKKAAEFEELGFYELANELYKKVELKDKLARITKFNYIKITDEKIKTFLNRKVELDDAQKPKDNSSEADNTIIGFADGSSNFITISNDPTAIWGTTAPNQQLYISNEVTIDEHYSKALEEQGFIRVSVNKKKKVYPTPQNISSKTNYKMENYIWQEALLDNYKTVPPTDVLDILKVNQKRNVFDYFTIATVARIKDPLLLGRIEYCNDRFYIAQWGEDIQLDDLI